MAIDRNGHRRADMHSQAGRERSQVRSVNNRNMSYRYMCNMVTARNKVEGGRLYTAHSTTAPAVRLFLLRHEIMPAARVTARVQGASTKSVSCLLFIHCLWVAALHGVGRHSLAPEGSAKDPTPTPMMIS